MSQKEDVYTRITQKIIDDLEKGELTWRKPWSSGNLANNVMRPLTWEDTPYKGVNTIVLWSQAAEKGYTSPYWMTLLQANKMKASVKSGEKGTQVVKVGTYEKSELDIESNLNVKIVPYLKTYSVFNAAQIEGLPPAYYQPSETVIVNPEQRIEAMEKFFAQTKAQIITGIKAAYSITADRIEMPPFECFNEGASYYSTLAHELTHWTRHPTRLNRDFNRKVWGDEGYAKEELVAELGACFLGADLGFEPVTKDDHAAYIKSWLSVLKNDKRFIFQAASFASKAVEYVTNLQNSPIKQPKPLIYG